MQSFRPERRRECFSQKRRCDGQVHSHLERRLLLLSVGRYIESNVIRAGLVADVAEWEWGGFFARTRGGKPFKMTAWPVDRPARWRQLLNENLAKFEMDRLRLSVNRGRPYGQADWSHRIATQLGLQSKMRNPGRPKQKAE
jgi:putative transposase